ncbi:MAG: LysE family translocator [Cytophagales bacterium]|nr:MAG: LysE family translocator [Cytophagales bacterium]
MIGFNITGYLIFALVTSITPGPNNYLLFSYGRNYGFQDSSKLMLGIFLGFFVLLCTSGYGIAGIIAENPKIEFILKIASSIWLFYLAIVLSKLSSNVSVDSNSKIGFFQGFFMQFVNPKAWIMAITGASAFLPQLDNIHLSVFIFATTFGLIGVPCMIIWISFGDLISKILKSERANKTLGIVLFGLMIFSIVMIWI